MAGSVLECCGGVPCQIFVATILPSRFTAGPRMKCRPFLAPNLKRKMRAMCGGRSLTTSLGDFCQTETVSSVSPLMEPSCGDPSVCMMDFVRYLKVKRQALESLPWYRALATEAALGVACLLRIRSGVRAGNFGGRGYFLAQILIGRRHQFERVGLCFFRDFREASHRVFEHCGHVRCLVHLEILSAGRAIPALCVYTQHDCCSAAFQEPTCYSPEVSWPSPPSLPTLFASLVSRRMIISSFEADHAITNELGAAEHSLQFLRGPYSRGPVPVGMTAWDPTAAIHCGLNGSSV